MIEKITHNQLINIGATWLNKKASNIYYKSQFVCTELVCHGVNEIPDIFGLRPYGHILIEVKVSRADFIKDQKKRGRNKNLPQLGKKRFFLTPKNLIKQDELPDGWGLLEYNGKNIEITRESDDFNESSEQAVYFYYSIIRRLLKPQILDFRKKK